MATNRDEELRSDAEIEQEAEEEALFDAAEEVEGKLRNKLTELVPNPEYKVGLLACLMLAGRLIAHMARDEPDMEGALANAQDFLTTLTADMFRELAENAASEAEQATHH